MTRDIDWIGPTQALVGAVDLATRLNHHVFDTLYHALALATPGAVLVTADRRYGEKALSLGQISWLPAFAGSMGLGRTEPHSRRPAPHAFSRP
jgi:hypothetical protein